MIPVEIVKILKASRSIAVVGCSRDESKDSYLVAKFLKESGFNVIPVNPFADKIIGEKAYESLSQIKKHVDIVDIFRPNFEVLPIVEEAIKLKPRLIWMQIGIANRKAYELASKNGIHMVMDKCIMIEYKYSMLSLDPGKKTKQDK